MAAVEVRRRRRPVRVAPRLRDPDLLEVGEERDAKPGPVGEELLAADDRLARRPAAVVGRVVLVVGELAAVPERAQVVREALPGVWKLR